MERHDEIFKAIGNLEGTVKTGFEAITNRLDAINGKVSSHDKQLLDIAVSDGKQNVKLGLIGAIAGGVMAFVMGMFK